MGGGRSDSVGVVGAAGVLIAVGCCARLPAVGAVVGGLGVAVVLGVACSVLFIAAALAAGVLLFRALRSRNCSSSTKGDAVTVELLYFEGCRNHDALLPHLERLLRTAQIPAEVKLREVPDDDAARRERFLGSPTVRVDGRDVEPGAEERAEFGLKCRLYRLPSGCTARRWMNGRLTRWRAPGDERGHD